MYSFLMDKLYPNRHQNTPQARAARQAARNERYNREVRQIDNGLIPYRRFNEETNRIFDEAEQIYKETYDDYEYLTTLPEGVNVAFPQNEKAFQMKSHISPIPEMYFKNRFASEKVRFNESLFCNSLVNQALSFYKEVKADIERLIPITEDPLNVGATLGFKKLSDVRLRFSSQSDELFDLSNVSDLSALNARRLVSIVEQAAWHAAFREFFLLPSLSSSLGYIREIFLLDESEREFDREMNYQSLPVTADGKDALTVGVLAAFKQEPLLAQAAFGHGINEDNSEASLTQYFMRTVEKALEYADYKIAPVEARRADDDLRPLFDSDKDTQAKLHRVPFCAANSVLLALILNVCFRIPRGTELNQEALASLFVWLERAEATRYEGFCLSEILSPWGNKSDIRQGTLEQALFRTADDIALLKKLGLSYSDEQSLAWDGLILCSETFDVFRQAFRGKRLVVGLFGVDDNGYMQGKNPYCI